jgi:hypothetical protein
VNRVVGDLSGDHHRVPGLDLSSVSVGRRSCCGEPIFECGQELAYFVQARLHPTQLHVVVWALLLRAASTRAARACSSASSGCRMPMNIRAWARSARCGSAVDLRRVGVGAAVSQPGSSARLCSAGWMCGVWQQPHVAHAPGSSAELKSRTTTRDLTCYRASRRSAPAMACVQAKRSGRGWFSWLASATARAPLPRARKSVALCSA